MARPRRPYLVALVLSVSFAGTANADPIIDLYDPTLRLSPLNGTVFGAYENWALTMWRLESGVTFTTRRDYSDVSGSIVLGVNTDGQQGKEPPDPPTLTDSNGAPLSVSLTLYADGGTSPGAALSIQDITLTSTAFTEYNFAFPDVTLSDGTRYWLIINSANLAAPDGDPLTIGNLPQMRFTQTAQYQVAYASRVGPPGDPGPWRTNYWFAEWWDGGVLFAGGWGNTLDLNGTITGDPIENGEARVALMHVPEPSTLAALMVAIPVAIAARRRQRARR
jgi:hypothetical protein